MPFIDDHFYALYKGGNPARTPVILLHGMGSSHLIWPASIRMMSGENVYALDLPGHGKSNGKGLQSISSYAKTVIQFMDKAEIFTAILVGHSMGSAVALQIAQDHSDRVAGLGLLSVGTTFRIEKNIQDSIGNTKMISDTLEWLSSMLLSSKGNKKIIEKVNKSLLEIRPAVLTADIHACMEYEFHKIPEGSNIIAQIICGAEDQIVPSSDARLLAKSIPGTKFECISNCGHVVMLEEPDKVGALLASFVKEVNSKTRYS
jgi:pimeloyl-ACP methyl ester carboxylesterase